MKLDWLRLPTGPLVGFAAIAPALAVAQYRVIAVAAPLAMTLAILAYWRRHGAWPGPAGGRAAGLAALLLAWCLVASAWSPEAWRGVTTTAQLAALLLLALISARVVARADAAERQRLGRALAAGLAAGFVLAAIDHASGNMVRLLVRGLPPPSPAIGFGLKPAMSFMVLLLPLVLAAAIGRLWRGALLVLGVAVVLWLPADTAKIAALVGLMAAGAAMLLPRLAVRAAALAFAAFILAAPLVFAFALARAPALESAPRSAAHRVLIWDFVGTRIAERPWLGWGMESSRAIPGGGDLFSDADLRRYGMVSPEARDWFASAAAKRLPLHSHNAALQVWLELGLVGAVLAAGLGAAALLAAAGAPAAFGMAVSAAITGQLSFGAWQPWWAAAMLMAAVFALALRPNPGSA